MRRFLTLTFRVLGEAPPQELSKRLLALLGREKNNELTIEEKDLALAPTRELLNALFSLSRAGKKEELARRLLKIMNSLKSPQSEKCPQRFWNTRLSFWKKYGQLSPQTQLLEKALTFLDGETVTEEEALTWLQLKSSKKKENKALKLILTTAGQESMLSAHHAISIEEVSEWIEGPSQCFGMVGGKLIERRGRSRSKLSLRCKEGPQEILQPLEKLTIMPREDLASC